MKIKTTVTGTSIECTADELRQSNTIADGLTNALRRALNGPIFTVSNDDEDEDEEDDESEDEE